MVPQASCLAFGGTEILVSGDGELSVGLYRYAFSKLNHHSMSTMIYTMVTQFKGV